MASFPPPSIVDDESSKKESWGPAQTQPLTRDQLFETALSLNTIDMKSLSKLARQGIPDRLRPTYWKLLIGYYPNTPALWPELSSAKVKEYLEIVSSVCKLNDDGTVVTGPEANRIDVDIPRTMPSLHFYAYEDTQVVNGVPVTFSHTQHALRRILHTLARVNKGLGYVQGMNEMVGHLLFTFAGGKSEGVTTPVECDAFFCFQSMLTYLGDNFCRSLDFDRDSGVTHTMRTFDRLFRACDTELWEYVSVQGTVRPEFYAFRWCTLLLTQEFLVPDVLRIWDFLFSHGIHLGHALFFTAVAMLIFQREELLDKNNMAEILVFLQQYPPCDVGELLAVATQLIDEYGFEKVDYVKNASDEEIEQSYCEVSTADEIMAKSHAIKVEVGTRISGWMSSVAGWYKERKEAAASSTAPK